VTEERQIKMGELLEMGRAYRDQRQRVIAAHGNNPDDSRACYFSKEIYAKILIEAQCDGIRTYYGLRKEPDGRYYHTVILVGTRNKVDALDEADYVAVAQNSDDPEVMYEWGSLCPPGKECAAGTLLPQIDEDLQRPT